MKPASWYVILARLMAFSVIIPFRLVRLLPDEINFWKDYVDKRRVKR